ncbi:phage portal protein, HK97 family [Alkalithermobacter thermoalcaliphilus JW-YL-7 = DSM 7308]|uniref:Phage portal protein, HK97 family n=1 Tax=Alkalithermobacter thermoalcaliphilus JW-YL-7 = DSM 7308 TaxID=1121328 RepID=A0A150FQZ4_CLOPD|nr:phage portal protein, HK97 family [[Clostridium] paradoxum JW-YL-7 = DSM 7308]SHL13478.1 phage portal protein, HK97 family [[Clostridium] paradoxum JW-YL-7 = DSM 7308]
MEFWNRFKNLFKTKNEVVNIDNPALLEWLGIETNDLKGKNALKQATVYACVKILSDSIAKLPLKVYQENEGIRKAKDHYIYPLLKLRPNPYMSAIDFWKCVETQRNIYGNAYVWVEYAKRGKNAGKIIGLYPIDTTKVQMYVDEKGVINSQNKIYYVVTDNLGNQYKVMPDEMLHFKGFTYDGIVGISPIEYLKMLIENAGSSTEFLNNSFKNGMQVKGIVHYIGDLNLEAERKFREKFEQMANGLKNANKVALLPIGYRFEPISLTMADAQFIENTQLTIKQIATAFGIKNHQLNDLDRATHTNIVEQQREFYVDTLLPILTMYEQELTYKLFLQREIEQGYYVKFNVDAILRSDIKTRYEAYRVGIQSGFITPNEARAMEEKEPFEGGDKLLVNGNMIPVEMAGEQYKKGGGKDEKFLESEQSSE